MLRMSIVYRCNCVEVARDKQNSKELAVVATFIHNIELCCLFFIRKVEQRNYVSRHLIEN